VNPGAEAAGTRGEKQKTEDGRLEAIGRRRWQTTPMWRRRTPFETELRKVSREFLRNRLNSSAFICLCFARGYDLCLNKIAKFSVIYVAFLADKRIFIKESFIAMKKTMTLNLTDAEMEVLEELAKKKDLSKTAIVRQALRLYQMVEVRFNRGEKLYFEDEKEKKKGELVVL
jgi:hypothetical protein